MSFCNIKKLRPDADIKNGCAIAVGIFDGVHLGHREMIGALVDSAKEKGIASAVFTFDFDDKLKDGAKLLSLPEKKEAVLKSLGVDIVISAPFYQIKELSATDFAKSLFDVFNAKSVICGYDFRFGKDRLGDVSLIKSVLAPFDVDIITLDALCVDGVPVSSTLIRKLVSNGEVSKVNKLLNRNFSFSGEIIHGVALAKTLGFPTANQIYPENLVKLRFGVYATEIVIEGKKYKGVTNVGVKPTFFDGQKPLCETFIFDFQGDCYGKNAEVYFIDFIRDETRFESKEELQMQVEKDKIAVLKLFEERSV